MDKNYRAIDLLRRMVQEESESQEISEQTWNDVEELLAESMDIIERSANDGGAEHE